MLIRHTLLYLPAQIVGPAAQFLAVLVFTHSMAPDAYGVLTYILASQDFVFLLCLFWWSQFTVRYFSAHAMQMGSTYRESEATILAASVVAQAGAALLALLAIAVPITPMLALATLLSTITRCLVQHLGERARARSRILDYTLAQSAGPVAGFVLAYIAVSCVAATPSVALLGYAVAQGAALVWLTLRQDIRLVARWPDAALLRQAMRFGLPLIAAGLAAWVGMNAIRILVDHDEGAAAMGLLAVGWNLGHRLTTTASMLVTVAAFPLAVESFRRGARDEAFAQITANGLLMLALLLPATVGLYLVQEPLVALLVAAPYRAMTLAILPAALAAGLFRNIRTHVADQIFILIERTPVVCAMTIAEAALVVVGCVLGLMAGGTGGAAVGSAVGFGAAMIAGFIVSVRRTGMSVPLADAGLIAIATAIMAATLLVLQRCALPANAIVAICAEVAVGAVVYAIALVALFPVLTRAVWSRWRGVAVP